MRFFSPFPHGTVSLSVTQEYLALRGGPRRFTRDFTCPMLLGSHTFFWFAALIAPAVAFFFDRIQYAKSRLRRIKRRMRGIWTNWIGFDLTWWVQRSWNQNTKPTDWKLKVQIKDNAKQNTLLLKITGLSPSLVQDSAVSFFMKYFFIFYWLSTMLTFETVLDSTKSNTTVSQKFNSIWQFYCFDSVLRRNRIRRA